MVGNLNYVECGTITGGRCDGDTLWGWGISQAEDKDGCAKGGNPGRIGIARGLEIIGKCASKCELGVSIQLFNPYVSNSGLEEGYELREGDKPEENWLRKFPRTEMM